MPRTAIPAARIALPGETLNEIHDLVTLALDATAQRHPNPYPQHIREARSYMRAAQRQTLRLLAEGV